MGEGEGFLTHSADALLRARIADLEAALEDERAKPQLTPEQAREARRWILGHRPTEEDSLRVGRVLDEANRTLSLIAERERLTTHAFRGCTDPEQPDLPCLDCGRPVRDHGLIAERGGTDG